MNQTLTMTDDRARRWVGIVCSLLGMFMLMMAGVCLAFDRWGFMTVDIFSALLFFLLRNVLWWYEG